MAERQHLADDFSLSRVPQNARVPMWDVLLVRVGSLVCLSQFILGATIGYGMSFWQAFWATMLGSIILEIVSLFIGLAGAREGLSTSLLARWAGFGKYGSSIIGGVIAVSLIGWFGVQNTVFAQGINEALNGALGVPLTATITGLAVTVLVIFGFKWLTWTAKITVPAFLIVIGFGIYQVMKHHSVTHLMTSQHPGPALSLGVAATMVAGGFMAGAVISPDYTRYCRNGKDVFWMTLIGIIVGELGVNLIAVLMAHAVKSSDIVTILTQTSGVLGAAIVIFSTIKINDLNLYSSSLGFSNIFDSIFNIKVNRGVLTLIIGVIGTLLSVFGILDKFQSFLVFLGIWIPPIASIIVVDYFILKTNRELLDESRIKGILPNECANFNPVILVAWAAGFIVGYFLDFGIPSLNSLIASGIVYYVVMKILNSRAVTNSHKQNTQTEKVQ